MEGAPGQSDAGTQGPGQEVDLILRAWAVSEGLSANEKWAHFVFQIKCLQVVCFCKSVIEHKHAHLVTCCLRPLLLVVQQKRPRGPRASSSLSPPSQSPYLGLINKLDREDLGGAAGAPAEYQGCWALS